MKMHLRSRRYLKYILLLTSFMLLILCMIFTFILYLNSHRALMRSISQTELERTTSLHTQSNLYFAQTTDICTSLVNLNIPREELTISQNLWARTTFNTLISSLVNSNTYIQNIDIKTEGISYFPSDIPHEYHIGEFYFFDIFTANKISWPYYFDLEFVSNKYPSAITLTINAFQLSNLVFSSDTAERLDYLITHDGSILLTNQKSAFFLNISDLYPELNLTDSTHPVMETHKDYYYSLTPYDKYGFRVLSLVPKTLYSIQRTSISLQTFLMACGLLLIAMIIATFLSIRFYRPINTMTKLLRTYIPDNLQDYENEVTFIYQNISKYIAKGKEADELIPKTMQQLHHMQTAVLQHQINSHFLFNTLENIKMISVMELGVENDVENSIILLNQIIHEGIFQKTNFVPLSHELQLARCYLDLMYLRFPTVKFSFEIDKTLLRHSVFKFSMQPILENCFSHAFKGDIDREKELTIYIQRENDSLAIRIKDNGHGMDEDSFRNLVRLLEQEDIPDSLHVGILNVHKRITNVFGKDYGITISSDQTGTCVTLLYPLSVMEQS